MSEETGEETGNKGFSIFWKQLKFRMKGAKTGDARSVTAKTTLVLKDTYQTKNEFK